MSLVDTKEMLSNAQKKHYAIGAFNIENMEMAQAVIWGASKLRSPVICAVSQNALKYATADLFCANVAALAKDVDIPVSVHVDHAETEQIVLKALRGGFTSIMIDGSKLTYIENQILTKKIVDICDMFSVPVEGELGALGGKIDAAPDSMLIYTDPEAARTFVDQTGVSSLAVAIGTAHGVYKDIPRLDYNRLEEIRNVVNVPLVLHGASGLSDEQMQECVSKGVCKVNIATELRIAYTSAVREFLATDSNSYDPKKFGKSARDAVQKIVEQKIVVLRSVGKC